MTRRRTVTLLASLALTGGIAACGSEGIKLPNGDKDSANVKRGAQLFEARCAGCHTMKVAGAQGSSFELKNRERVDGPNFDVRKEELDQVLFAIRNGGYSGAIMPQNIVVGEDADDVAAFVAEYSGREARSPRVPDRQTQPEGGTREESLNPEDESAGGQSGGGGTSDAP